MATMAKTGWKKVLQCSALVLGTWAGAGQALAQTSSPVQFTVTTIDRAGATGTQLWGINDQGTVVGTDSLGSYLYNAGTVTALSGIANASQISAFGISNNGTVVGSWVEQVSESASITHGFIYQGGGYTTFDLPLAGGTFTQIRSISSDGRFIAGFYGAGNAPGQGFVYDLQSTTLQTFSSTGQMLLHGINNSGLAVGSLTGSVGGGVVADFSGLYSVTPTVLNPAVRPSFRGVNEAGQVSGFYTLNGASSVIFGTLGNAASFQTVAIAGAVSAIGEGINNQGTLVGFYTDASGVQHGFMAAAVPEPSTVLLFVSGLAAVGWARRRQVASTTQA